MIDLTQDEDDDPEDDEAEGTGLPLAKRRRLMKA